MQGSTLSRPTASAMQITRFTGRIEEHSHEIEHQFNIDTILDRGRIPLEINPPTATN